MGSWRCLSLAVALAVPIGAQAAPQQSGLDPSWYDGQAEISGYRWHGTRYGEERTGEAVAIFVTERFSRGLHVKVGDAGAIAGDATTAMKLNLVRDFQTGIYDYNTMTSVFVDAEDLGLMKSTFSSAEWCGHVFETIDVRAGVPAISTSSYFEGESGMVNLAAEPDALIGDQLFIWLRGLHGAPLQPGESIRLPFLRSAFERRLFHREAAWKVASIERDVNLETIRVPAGNFKAITYRIRSGDPRRGPSGHAGVIHIEAAAPHRLLAWSLRGKKDVIDAGELTGTKRMKYWSLNREGHQQMRASIGLAERP